MKPQWIFYDLASGYWMTLHMGPFFSMCHLAILNSTSAHGFSWIWLKQIHKILNLPLWVLFYLFKACSQYLFCFELSHSYVLYLLLCLIILNPNVFVFVYPFFSTPTLLHFLLPFLFPTFLIVFFLFSCQILS